jgi:hypothetical protein
VRPHDNRIVATQGAVSADNLVGCGRLGEWKPCEPILALQKINFRLKPNGYALFEMPNIEALDIRLKRVLANIGIHQKQFSEDYLPGHCNEFCRASFQFLLEKTGFKLIRWETYSMKPVVNFLYTHLHIGNKARALVAKTDSIAPR